MPAFRDLLKRVAAYYREQGTEIAAQNEQLQAALAAMVPQPDFGAVLDDSAAGAGARARSKSPSMRPFGGFSAARRNSRIRPASSAVCGSGTRLRPTPKPDLQALYMASLTLTRMAEGGIYDQLGGRIRALFGGRRLDDPAFRENAVRQWAIAVRVRPRAFGDRRGAVRPQVAHETADWVLRDMRLRKAAFTPASMPTPKATRASSTRGPAAKCSRC